VTDYRVIANVAKAWSIAAARSTAPARCGRMLSARTRGVAALVAVLVLAITGGCGGTPVAKETVDAQRAIQERAAKDDLNRKLSAMAVATSRSDRVLQQEYPVGPGDVLDITVFEVEELNTKVRINGKGTVILPLLGEIDVGGKPLSEVENLIVERLKEFMHSPQVSIFIDEYQSQQISVTGAVNDPALHTLSRPRTVLEVLSLSGGLSEKAGNKIYVQTTMEGQSQRLIIDLDEVLANPDEESLAIVLGGGDSIFVPEAGTVFVEGAVNKPGGYELSGDTGVIEAIAMAGGAKFEAREGEVQVITMSAAGGKEVVNVDLDKLRANETAGISLQDGDIVLVPTSGLQAGFAGFWRGITGIFSVGYGVQGP
jgi:polysaccharide biosynthesis/export protein